MRIECPECKSGAYDLINRRTGEVMCLSCLHKWIVPELGASSPASFTQPYVSHAVISPEDQKAMEATSGFKQGPLPMIESGAALNENLTLSASKPTGKKPTEAVEYIGVLNRRKPTQNRDVLKIILYIVAIIAMMAIAVLIETSQG